MAYTPSPNLPLSPEDVKAWWSRVELAEQALKPYWDQCDALLQAYLPSAQKDAINSNRHFRNTEQKKAQLFFQLPEIRLRALEPLKSFVDPLTGQPRVDLQGQPITAEDIPFIKQAVLNQHLGRDGVNIKRLFDRLLFDVLQPCGRGVSKICYDPSIQETPDEVPIGDQPNVGSVLGLDTIPQMGTQIVPVTIYEEWQWVYVSPKKFLRPHDWLSTDFDRAPWLGMKFVKPNTPQARKAYGLPDDFVGTATTDDAILKSRANQDGAGMAGQTSLIEGIEIWLLAIHFDPTVAHPLARRRLVLVKGLEDRAATYTPSPYQTFDARGRLTPDSMTRSPLRVLTLRDLTDAAEVPSDAAFTDPLIKQKNTWRSQSIKQRDANIPRFLYDASIESAIKALQHADVGEGAKVASGLLQQGIERLIAELPKFDKSASDIEGERAIDRDIDETLAIGSNQAGNENDKVLSATEVSVMQGNANVRLEAEQQRVTDHFLEGVREFDALIMRYATEEDYIAWVGVDGARRVTAWTKELVAGRFAYDILPDSQLRPDLAAQRKQFTDYMNFNAKNPFINLLEMTKLGADVNGYDKTRLVKPPDPPQPTVESLSVAMKIEDFAGPAAPIAFKMATQVGWKIDEKDVLLAQLGGIAVAQAEQAEANATHGGAAEKADPVSKHSADETGQLPGPTTQQRPM